MLNLNNITKAYGDKTVFKNLNIELQDNKITAIMGNSGVGKTTLMNVIAGLTDYEGEVIGRPERISFVFQTSRLIPNLTVFQNVEYVLKSVYKDSEERKAIVQEYLAFAEISELANKFPNKISGGEGQRVQLARAFCYPSKLLIMDEPFSSLDVALKTRLMKLYTNLIEKSPRTSLFVTHDPFEALTLADTIYVMKKEGLKRFDIETEQSKRNADCVEINSLREKIYFELQN